MPLLIIENDITKMKVDAIVNAANRTLCGGGGVDGCIHRAAGRGLLEECRTLGGCETGKAKITGAYNLPCKYVIHTVGPIYKDGRQGERLRLISCYYESLTLAKNHGCETVAFPLISAGVYGYPKAEAVRVALTVISEFLRHCDMTVYLVIFDKASFISSYKQYGVIASYVDETFEEQYENDVMEDFAALSFGKYSIGDICAADSAPDMSELHQRLTDIDESFSEMLLRKIDESGMTDAECYKKANIDRKLFSKIRNDKFYSPSKPTAIAFAIALKLSLDETESLLKKAGFALSHSNKFDIIIEFFIKNGVYNIMDINEALFAFDQNLLGG